MLKMPDENKFPGVSNYIHDYGMNLVVLKNLSKEVRLMQKYELDENTARDYMDQYWLK